MRKDAFVKFLAAVIELADEIRYLHTCILALLPRIARIKLFSSMQSLL